MNYLSIFVISFTVALSGALAPSPLLAAVIHESTKQGVKSGPLIILGHAIIEIAMVALIMLGVGQIINNPLVLKVISLLGAFILLYFGFTMFLSLPKLSLELKNGYHKKWSPPGLKPVVPKGGILKPPLSPPLRTGFASGVVSNLTLMGIILSFANPYWTLWWITIGLGMVLAAQRQGLLAVLIFFCGHIAADLSWYTIVSLMFGKGRRFISDRIYKIISGLCAGLLAGFGVYFAASSFKY